MRGKNRPTLFGEFVEALNEHFSERGGLGMEVGDLVYEITMQGDASQVSRYTHEHKGDRGLLWYHKYTITQIIVKSNPGVDPDPDLFRKKGLGYSFVGRWDSELTVETLACAIERAMGQKLERYLSLCPLDPSSSFCEKMCELYGTRYGAQGGHASDLERYVGAIDEDLDAATRSKEIYKRVLLAILLGPEAVPAIARVTSTAKIAGPEHEESADGFSLTQTVVRNGELVPSDSYGFETGTEVLMGLPANPEADYSPEFADGVQPFVSFRHALICPAEESDEPRWRVVNLSESNGTAVRREDGSVVTTKVPGEGVALQPRDEIWLAPFVGPDGVFPEYRHGAVIRFEHLYPTSRLPRVGKPDRDHAEEGASGRSSLTPVYEASGKRSAAMGPSIGFILGDLTFGTGNRVYHYADLSDEDGYFYLLLGRRGDHEVGVLMGSAVSQKHAYIECMGQGSPLMLTNHSSNEIVVRHPGGSFDVLKRWQCLDLSDNDEIYLGGGVAESGPFAASNGAAISFRYLYKEAE